MSCIDVTLPAPPPFQKLVLVVAAALIDADGRVLLAQRPPGKDMAGLWEFPGGKIGNHETPEQALCRELREELGIETSPFCVFPISFASHAYETFHLLMPFYGCRVWRGDIQAKEKQKLIWARMDQLDGFEMPPADIPLIAALRDRL